MIIASTNAQMLIIEDLNQQYEAVLTLDNTWLSGKQPDMVKIVTPYKKVDLQWCPEKMRKTKKKHNKEKTKIEEVG